MHNLRLRDDFSECPAYIRLALKAAGIYNLVWGFVVILFPISVFLLFDMQPPLYPQIWQCVGMIVGVYGIGYLIAAQNPFRHWPIILVGLLGKLFGPIGFLIAATRGELPWSWSVIIIFNDLLWWVPFTHVLYLVAKQNSESTVRLDQDLKEATFLKLTDEAINRAPAEGETLVMPESVTNEI